MKELARKIRRENLSPHSNFSFTVSDDELWADASVNNSLFNGAIFQGCIFRNLLTVQWWEQKLILFGWQIVILKMLTSHNLLS